MKVFISYGGTADQITALRLQALAVAHGLTVYVPPAYTRKEIPDFLDPQSAQKLSEAEIILGLVGTGLAKACQQELHTGIALHKNMIVMSDPEFVPVLQQPFEPYLVVIDPANPDQSYVGIVQHLKAIDAQQNAKKALLALGTLLLGLLILAPADQS